MSEPVNGTIETRPVPRWRLEPETFAPRIVDRETAPWLQVEDRSDLNFRGDVEIMLQIGEHFSLDERDFRFLYHILKFGIRPGSTGISDIVSLSNRQWHVFNIIRRKFIRSYRSPSFFFAYHRTIRSADTQTIAPETTNQI